MILYLRRGRFLRVIQIKNTITPTTAMPTPPMTSNPMVPHGSA
jgi:hypothetical protein